MDISNALEILGNKLSGEPLKDGNRELNPVVMFYVHLKKSGGLHSASKKGIWNDNL